MWWQRGPRTAGSEGNIVCTFVSSAGSSVTLKTDGVLERKTAKETALRPASSAWLEPGTNVTHTETAQQRGS